MLAKTDRIGETRIMTCGMKATVVAYRTEKDIDILFEDGHKACHKGWREFLAGKIRNKNIKIKGNYASKPCSDDMGNTFASESDMCRFHKINLTTYKSRLKSGMTKAEALSMPRQSTIKNKDHSGREYDSLTEKCKFHKVNVTTYKSRIAMGYTEEYALSPEGLKKNRCLSRIGETRTMKNKEQATIKDYLGNGMYMVEFLDGHKVKSSYKNFLNGEINHTVYRDHNGAMFNSPSKMCEKYNMSYHTVYSRLKDGRPLGLALTDIAWNHKVYDHKGQEYPSNKEMAKTYGFATHTMFDRLRSGWTLAEALEIPRNLSLGEYRTAECLKRMNVRFYHDCTIKRIFTDLKIDVKWSAFLEKLQQNLEDSGVKWSKQRIEKLRPDFVLLNDDNGIRGVIEFDGTQHQRFTDHFFATVAEFLMRCDADAAKQSLWEYLGIPMLRIRNDQADRIDNMVSDFLARPEFYIQNHNPFLKENEYWAPLNSTLAELGMAMA